MTDADWFNCHSVRTNIHPRSYLNRKTAPWTEGNNLLLKLIVTQLAKKLPRLLYDSKVHDRVHKSPPLIPIMSQMQPVHTFPLYFPRIHSNIIFPSTPRTSVWSLPFRISDQNFVRISHLSCACYMSLPTNPPLLDHANSIWWRLQVMKLLITQSSLASRHFLPLNSKFSSAPCCKHPQCERVRYTPTSVLKPTGSGV
jgi:hypothetical protein